MGRGYLCLPAHGRVLGGRMDNRSIWPPTVSGPIRQGTSIQGGGGYVGRLGLYAFADNGGCWRKMRAACSVRMGRRRLLPRQKLHWKWVENANVDMLQEMSDMMTAQRALESAAQVLKLYDGVLTKATTELGRL